jgi:hypothetical protein
MISWFDAQQQANGNIKIAETLWLDALYDHFADLPLGFFKACIEFTPRNNLSHDKWFLAIQKNVNSAKEQYTINE